LIVIHVAVFRLAGSVIEWNLLMGLKHRYEGWQQRREFGDIA